MKKWEYVHLFYNNGDTYLLNHVEHNYQSENSSKLHLVY